MKRLGLIGGSGWPSTLEYYRLLNTYFGQERGGAHALDMILRNLDFEIFRDLLGKGYRQDAIQMLIDGVNDCKKAGATCVAFSANGLHRFWSEIESQIGLPFIHIAEATGAAIAKTQVQTIGLIGVRATMESDFYPKALQKFGVTAMTPNEPDKEMIDRVIFQELVHGKFTKDSKDQYLAVMDRLAGRGAEGIILGCTEIPLLLNQSDFHLPLFATTEIHCKAILDFILR